MASVSPSSQKVDDFLSSLSQLSQERLHQDQQRQRDLQRNVDSLRQKLASLSPVKSDARLPIARYEDTAPLLQFNRSRRSDENPPQLPRRRDESPPPALPRRRDEFPPPALPKRQADTKKAPLVPKKPNELASRHSLFSIELVNPVARSESSYKSEKYPEPTSTSYKNTTRATLRPYKGPTVIKAGEKDTYRSFAEVESAITKTPKADWLSSSINKSPTSKQANTTPKPSYLSAISSAQNSRPDHLASPVKPQNLVAQKYVPQDNKTTTVVSPAREKNTSSWIDSSFRSPPKPADSRSSNSKDSFTQKLQAVSKKEPERPAAKKPLVPAKPNLDTYKSKDEEILQAQLAKIKRSAPPTKPKPSFSKFEASDTQGLKTQLHKLAPAKPSKPTKLENFKDKDNELLNSQINKLKSSTTTKPALPIKPKPQVLTVATSNTPLAAKSGLTSELSAPVDFRDKLSSIIRASTDPQIASNASTNNVSTSKNTTIARANTLPIAREKRQDATREGTLVHATKARAKGPKRRLPKLLKAQDDRPAASAVKAKVPPPVNKLAKPRAVPGARISTSSGSVATGSATPHVAPSFDEELFI